MRNQILTGIAVVAAGGIMLGSGVLSDTSAEAQVEEGAILRIVVTASTDVTRDGVDFDAGEVLYDRELATAETIEKCEEGGKILAALLEDAGNDNVDIEVICRMAPMHEVEELENTLGEQNLAGGRSWNGMDK